MPRIQANRDTIDDRFSVLGFSVRTESPLFEVAVATDPELFKPENRARRARRNFYSSRSQGVIRARRGEAIYLLPPDVLANFLGQQRLYFGLATYRENTRGTPDFVQAPSAGSMYVSMSNLSERGLRRGATPSTPSSYGVANGRDPSLDWGGDAVPAERSAPPLPVAGTTPNAKAAPSASTPSAGAAPSAVAAGYAGSDYDDGFGVFPEDEAPLAQAQDLLLRDYNGGLLDQLRFMAESVQWFAGVSNTRDFPHSAICQVFDPARGAEAEQGTAFYIGRNLLLTAAHVVDGMNSLIFVPGKNGLGVDSAHEPFGRFTVSSADWRKHDSYRSARRDFDFAIVKTPQAAPGGRWFNLLEELNQSRPEGVLVCGYSVRSRQSDAVSRLVSRSIDSRKQHLHRGAVRTLDGETFSYDIQTLPGNSGSPVYWVEASRPPRAHLVGVHVAGDDEVTNKGCRLTTAKIAWIRARAAEWGQSSAMAVDDEVLEEALAIPLDPGVGGRSIGTSALQAGDLIVSTTRHFVSRVIRLGTLSPVSHVMLYAGAGRVIEAVQDGVRDVPLATAIDDAILAVAYRHPRLDAVRMAAVVAHARSRVGNPYNLAGVAYQGVRIMNPLPTAVIDAIGRRLGVEVGQAGAVYCSELVLESFERAGLPLTNTRPSQSTPDQVAHIARGTLSYVGHLKAEDVPLGIQFGMADALAADVPDVEMDQRQPAAPALAYEHEGWANAQAAERGGNGSAEREAGTATLEQALAAATNEPEPAMERAPAPAPIIQQPLEVEPVAQAQAAPLVIPIAAAVVGAISTRVLSNSGDVSWELDQLNGLKHPNDQLPNPLPPFQDGTPIRLVDWPSSGRGQGISAGFEIRWQHNGQSLGNVQIINLTARDALGWGLTVKARIMNDSIVYPRNDPRFAALRVRLEYRFTRALFSDQLAFREVHLFGNGTYNMTGDWTQNSTF